MNLRRIVSQLFSLRKLVPRARNRRSKTRNAAAKAISTIGLLLFAAWFYLFQPPVDRPSILIEESQPHRPWPSSSTSGGARVDQSSPNLALPPDTRQAIPADAYPAHVISVHDGDTLRLRPLKKVSPNYEPGEPVTVGLVRELRQEQLQVRLCSIDAPEIQQEFGTISRDFLESELSNRQVFVVVSEKDRYGRHVATLYLPDGTNMNRLMVARGMAWHYSRYSRDPKLKDLEAQARAAGLGVWAVPKAIAPWEYRKRSRAAQP